MIDEREPLRGLTLVLDAGHPPGGTIGPTGLREAEITLDVAGRTAELLKARGARVILSRTGSRPVSLAERVTIATRADAHAVVSIHLESDLGVGDPYRANGSHTYYLHPFAAPLADSLRLTIARSLRVPAKRTNRRDLALTRPMWFPAVLCEGTMLVIPEEEAKLRTPQYRQAYATGIALGIENHFRAIGIRQSVVLNE
jgi:N-acetylmuramoyl-L-alanine amidase